MRETESRWSPAIFNVERLMARAGAGVAARGRAYYAQKWRLRVQHVSADEAVIRVQGSQRYTVEFMKDGNRVLAFCDCPYAGYEEGVVCKHIVAAALFLRDYLKQNTPVPWEDVLSQAVRTSSSPASKKPAAFLFFSLQARGNSWAVVPYTVASSFFPETARHDASETARVVIEQKLSSQAEKIGPYEHGEQRLYANVTHMQGALVKMLASSGIYYGNYYGGATRRLAAPAADLQP
ncbi:MAG: SWIM zinc finger family protein, partial [Pyrinomonadaceae bacterium]